MFGFTITQTSDYARAAVTLKRKADGISSKEPKLKQERCALYIQAAVFWFENAAVLTAPDCAKSGATAASVQAGIIKRHDRARALYSQTSNFLAVMQSEFTRAAIPWLLVAAMRMRAMCAFFACSTDMTKLKRIKTTVELPILAAKQEKLLAANGGAAKKNASSLPPSAADVSVSTPPLTPASPASTGSTHVSTGVTSLSLADCTDLVSLLKDLESLQEARDMWRAAGALETMQDAKAKKASANQNETDLVLAKSPLNIEHLESNTPDAVIQYLKRAVPAAIKLYNIPPYVHDAASEAALSLSI